MSAALAYLMEWVGDILGLVRSAAGGIASIWIFPVAVGMFIIGLTISVISKFLAKRKGKRR